MYKYLPSDQEYTSKNISIVNDLSFFITVAPIKALCSERYEDWKNKFSTYGLKSVELTGDTEYTHDMDLITSYQLIITTPEKWDSLTRKCKELKCLLNKIKLFLIDEV